MLDGVTDLYVAKGRTIVHTDLTTERPSDDELLTMMLGRSGKLRAPAIRSEGRLLVGYNAEMLGAVLT